jgi:DNA repair/transcription protein MET18/MMS19
MIKSIFTDVYVQSFPQASRYNVYVILLHFLLNRYDSKSTQISFFVLCTFLFKAVQQLGSDFVCNFIQSMDGERDPRNLVLCFQCLQYMTKYLDIGKIIHDLIQKEKNRNFFFFLIEPYKEELFEVVACYFPMEYKPVRI